MSNKKRASMAALRANAKPPQGVVPLCVRGDLNAEYGRLETELQEATTGDDRRLSDVDPRRLIVEKMDAVRAEMLEHTYEFLFQALAPLTYSNMTSAHPPRKGVDKGDFNLDTFPAALIAACSVEPKMTAEDVGELVNPDEAGNSLITQAQFIELFNTCFALNNESVSIPFSVLASVIPREPEPS